MGHASLGIWKRFPSIVSDPFLHLNTVLPLIGARSCVLTGRRLVAGRDVFHDIHIVALPWPDSIGNAGTSTHIEAYEKEHGVKVCAAVHLYLVQCWRRPFRPYVSHYPCLVATRHRGTN